MIETGLLRRVQNVLVIGAHSDDIEIGAGGTVLNLLEQNPQVNLVWVVLGAEEGARHREAAESAAAFLKNHRNKQVILEPFRNSFFPFLGAQIKEKFESLRSVINPDLILTHTRDDAHQDHRLVCDLTWNTFRNHMILEYEIPKYDGDLGRPNVFVPLSQEQVHRKIEHLMHAFPSQTSRQWFTPETFQAMLRIRGIECNAPSGFAEAFYCRKMTV